MEPASIKDPNGIETSTPEERINVGAAYLSVFIGLWFFAPLALYLWKGKSSRFVAFHAAQAIVLHLAMIPTVFVGDVLGLVAYGALDSLRLPGVGGRLLMELVFYTPVGLGTSLPLFLTVWMGIAATRGHGRALPLLGRWAEHLAANVRS
jgi:uncharacterized membrane protein